MSGLLRYGTIGALSAALAACAAKQEPVVAPPPPPMPQVVIPPKPRPPLGAANVLAIPPLNAAGMRQTVNLNISPAQTIWNFRSAYNVAALNCMHAEHVDILGGYKAFLKANAKRLTAVNKDVDKEFRAAKGAGATKARESYMTQVYNFYALPPTMPAFCDVALAVSREGATVPAKGLDDFAKQALPRLDRVLLDFFNSYDQYRADLAAWQQRYTPTSPVIAPAPVATAPAASVPAPR